MPFKIVSTKNWESIVAKEAMQAVEHLTNEMGAEIHDDLMHRLVVFRFYFDRMERELNHPEQLNNLLTEMKGEFQEVVQSVRKISRQLMPAKTDQKNFTQSIHLLCMGMERPGAGHIHFECDGTEQPLTDQSEIYLSRIVQELIHNAFKHSAAWHIWVRMHWDKDKLLIDVEDDGTGFMQNADVVAQLKKKYNTLKMRSQAIGATIKYENGANGLLARITLPITTST
jgi:signal transduction histidine kinase